MDCIVHMNITSTFNRAVVLVLFLFLSTACASRSTSSLIPNANQEVPAQNQSNPPTVKKSILPSPTGFVNDYANVFDPESKRKLESVLTELKNKSEVEFAVVTVETTGGQPIFDYSLALAKEWGVGPEDVSKGGGLLLMIAVKDRQWRLQVSRSLEKDLPDDVSKKLGDQSTKFYKQGNYREGITRYVRAIIDRLEKKRRFKLSNKP
jgi:uncharacterized membrane protein YgcG